MKTNDFLRTRYALEENPFIEGRASQKWLDTWVDRKKELRDWKRLLDQAEKGNTNQIAFIIGEYGQGKTLSLLKVVDEASKRDSVHPVYLNFQGEQKPRKPGLDFLLRLLKSIALSQLVSKVSEKRRRDAIKSISKGFDEPKEVLNRLCFGDDGMKRLASYFLSGEVNPSKKELESLGVIRKMTDVEVAKEYLAGILLFLGHLGYTSILFAVDEFEYLFSLVSKSQRTIYLALLRGLYDLTVDEKQGSSMCKVSFFVAISRDGWRKLNEMEEQEMDQGGPIRPLLRRVALRSVLHPFDKQETKELVVNRLRFDRIKGRQLSKPLIPFTNDFVDLVYNRSKGDSWKIIFICSHVLDAGLEKGTRVLDKRFAESVLKERNLPI
jgi:hypothetical protein